MEWKGLLDVNGQYKLYGKAMLALLHQDQVRVKSLCSIEIKEQTKVKKGFLSSHKTMVFKDISPNQRETIIYCLPIIK